MEISIPFNHFVAFVWFREKHEDSIAFVDEIARKIIDKLNLKVIKGMSHKFEPEGVTTVMILSQSHLAIHTWSNEKLLHVDLVSCGVLSEEEFVKKMREVFSGYEVIKMKMERVTLS